jgi:hypothetical protein
MKIGQIYKVVFRDFPKDKIVIGELIDQDEYMVFLNDPKLGEVGVGRSNIISTMERKGKENAKNKENNFD